MLKLPAVGFIQATYWVLCISLRVSFCLSYLQAARNERTLGLISIRWLLECFYAPVTENCKTRTKCVFFSPVAVVQMLAYQCMRLHCSISINSWHVHVVYKVDQLPVAYRGVAFAGSFLQRLLQNPCNRKQRQITSMAKNKRANRVQYNRWPTAPGPAKIHAVQVVWPVSQKMLCWTLAKLKRGGLTKP